MVNSAFACQFRWGCKFEGKCGIYHLCPLFNLSLHIFAADFALSKFSFPGGSPPTPPESLRMLADAKTQICRIHRLPDFLTQQNLVILHAI